MNRKGQKIGFLGAGRTATALALGLSNAGYVVTATASRSLASAQALAARLPGCQAMADQAELLHRCDVVFLTVPDDAIATVAAALPWRKGQSAVHCSGALSLDVLTPAQERGVQVGGLHPLQTFATLEGGDQSLAGSTFAIEGEGALHHWLEEAVQKLGGRAIHLPSQDRPLYHAAAVISCGYVATLLDAASALWEAMGFPREEVLPALLPLTRGTLRNVEAQGPRDGATGPILRGDTDTVRQHLVALAERAPEVLSLYCQAGLATIAMAQERDSIGPEQARDLRRLLHSYLERAADAPYGLDEPEAVNTTPIRVK